MGKGIFAQPAGGFAEGAPTEVAKEFKKSQMIFINYIKRRCIILNYNKCTTLGSRNKKFEWTYSVNNGITIYRKFRNGPNKVVFTNDDIEKIVKYIELKDEIELANNVQKLYDGTEKEGIGKFIFENIENKPSTAQASSQLAAIFYKVGILGYNQKSRGMKFWLLCSEWQKAIMKNLDDTTVI